MATYSATSECYVDVEFSFDVDPGYKGSRTEPPEAPAVINLSAVIVGPRGERLACPDWLVPLLAGSDDSWLLAEAEGAREEAMCAAADARREVAIQTLESVCRELGVPMPEVPK
jgi:hypothetical protein